MINVGEVGMVSITDIEIGDRARQEMGDLEGLEANMKQSGLITPLAVKRLENGKYFLLAGERRFGVLFKNKASTIPVRIYPADITSLQMKSIELAENFHRKDFEHWEHDNLIRDIHKTQQEIHGEKISTLANAPGWGMKDTGELVGKEKGTVSSAIKRANARDAFPELFEMCKTQKDASKVMKKLDEEIIRDVLVQKIASQKIDTDKEELMNSFILKNFFEGIQEVPDNYIHLVEIDPPYAIELKSTKKGYTYGDSYNEISKEDYPEFMQNVLKACYQKMADHSWLLCWYAPEPWQEDIYDWIIDAGFDTHRMDIKWIKPGGQCMRPELHMANSYESCYYAWKGRPAIATPGRRNWSDLPPVPAAFKTHPTERPVELTTWMYETFAWPGSRVLIPFLGSGNGLLSAKELGMSAFGYELSKSYRDSFLVKVYKM